MNKPLAEMPQPPYYAVVFTSVRTTVDEAGYGEMAACMLELAARQPGYLGVESVRNGYGVGITVSYWTDLDAIHHWREVAEHRAAQQFGRRNGTSSIDCASVAWRATTASRRQPMTDCCHAELSGSSHSGKRKPPLASRAD